MQDPSLNSPLERLSSFLLIYLFMCRMLLLDIITTLRVPCPLALYFWLIYQFQYIFLWFLSIEAKNASYHYSQVEPFYSLIKKQKVLRTCKYLNCTIAFHIFLKQLEKVYVIYVSRYFVFEFFFKILKLVIYYKIQTLKETKFHDAVMSCIYYAKTSLS